MHKKKMSPGKTVVGILLLIALIFSGCAGAPEGTSAGASAGGESKTTEAEGSGSGSSGSDSPEWEIKLAGVRVDAVTSATFGDAKEHESHYQNVSFEKKDEMVNYRAMPFSLLVAMVDGEDGSHPWSFDEEAWREGYDITLTAADDYAVTFSTADIDPTALFLADEMEGEAVLPRIVGDVPGTIQIKDLVMVELSLGGGTSQEEFTLAFEINGQTTAYTREELEALPYFIEDTGSYTTSAGTTHTHRYGGIKFADFLKSFIAIEEDATVEVVAMDGYTMSYSYGELADENDGTWILAFKSDGEYLPLDPGYIRSVKVGPEKPNIDGHSSARMIKKVVVSGESYKEYELLIKGKMESLLDRQTVQSGVSCHKKTVTYYDRKADKDESYTGIPLWLLLAYGDDPDHAPHHQTDKSILSYKEESALAGYQVKISAADGFSITLDSRELHQNDDVIIATMKDGQTLPERDWPMAIVWDKDAQVVPEGIKAVRNIVSIELIFD